MDNDSPSQERLQKVLASQGLASRRAIEQWIQAGRIQVNGAPAQLGQKVDPASDRIVVDGRPVKLLAEQEKIYLLLHKPKDVVSTCNDPQQRNTVLDLLPEDLQTGKGIHPVGRLDRDSTGALLLTNDGDLTFRLTHPRHGILKTYRVWVQGYLQDKTLAKWQSGVELIDENGRARLTAATEIEVLCLENRQTCLRIQMREGRNRQIRRVAEQLGHPVQRLHRLAIGPVALGDLGRGRWRKLKGWELHQLRQMSGKGSGQIRGQFSRKSAYSKKRRNS